MVRNNSWIDNSNSGSGAAHLAYNPNRSDFLAVWNNLFTRPHRMRATFNNLPPAPFGSAGYNLLPDELRDQRIQRSRR